MGTKGMQLLGNNLETVLNLLQKAYADEWLAHYQYWIGAKIVKGPMKENVIAELIQHSADELRHAEMVANRIIQLGGTPITHPAKWFDMTTCGYEEPLNEFVSSILDQNISGEQCAIQVYSNIMDITRDIDPITYNIALQILSDEVEHEEDLQSLSEDIKMMLENRMPLNV